MLRVVSFGEAVFVATAAFFFVDELETSTATPFLALFLATAGVRVTATGDSSTLAGAGVFLALYQQSIIRIQSEIAEILMMIWKDW